MTFDLSALGLPENAITGLQHTPIVAVVYRDTQVVYRHTQVVYRDTYERRALCLVEAPTGWWVSVALAGTPASTKV